LRAHPSVRKLASQWAATRLTSEPPQVCYVLDLIAERLSDRRELAEKVQKTLLVASSGRRVLCSALKALASLEGASLEALVLPEAVRQACADEWAATVAAVLDRSPEKCGDRAASCIVSSNEPQLMKRAAPKSQLVRDALCATFPDAVLEDAALVEAFAAPDELVQAVSRLAAAVDPSKLDFVRAAARVLEGRRFVKATWHPSRAAWVARVAADECSRLSLEDFVARFLPAAVDAYRRGDRATCDACWSLAAPTCGAAEDVERAWPSFVGTVTAALESAEPSILLHVVDALARLADNESAPRAALARQLLPSLIAAALDDRDVLSAIQRLAGHADERFAASLFRKVVKRLAASGHKRKRDEETGEGALCEVGAALARRPEERETLWRALKPLLLHSRAAAVEKRAYAALASLCSQGPSSFDADLVETVAQCPARVPARCARLRCMLVLVETRGADVATELVSEAALCVKDANAKARRAAFDVLDAMTRALDPSHLLRVLVAGLAARTPHARSAALAALARVVFRARAADLDLLRAACLVLRHDKAREVAKAALGLVAVLLATLDDASLEPTLTDLVASLLAWAPEKKARFRTRVKSLLRKLCRRFGYESIKSLVPRDDEPLVAHLRKVDDRSKKKRRRAAASRHERPGDDDDDDDDEQYFRDDDDDDESEDLENVEVKEDGRILVTSEEDQPRKPDPPPPKIAAAKRRRPSHLKGKQATAAKRRASLKGDATKPGKLLPYDWKPLADVVKSAKRRKLR